MRQFLGLIFFLGVVFPGISSVSAQPLGPTPTADPQDIEFNVTVQPKQTDLEFSLTADVSEDTELGANQEVEFTISYRSLITGSLPFTIRASWDDGEVVGSPGNYVDVYDYVIGSASLAHDGTIPVVDLVQRTITWEIPVLDTSPTPHTVTFRLKTKSVLSTDQQIEVFTKADASFSKTPIPEEDYRLLVKVPFPPTPTPTVSPSPTASPSPTSVLLPSATPGPGGGGDDDSGDDSDDNGQEEITPTMTTTPTPENGFLSGVPSPLPGEATPDDQPEEQEESPPEEVTELVIERIVIKEIDTSFANVEIQTNIPAVVTISYGLCSASRDQQAQSDGSSSVQIVRLEGLSPEAEYCFTIKAEDVLNNFSVEPEEVFTFTTARLGEGLDVKQTFVSSNNIFLTHGEISNVIVPIDETVVFTMELENAREVARVTGSFVGENVQGVDTMVEKRRSQVDMIQLSPGYFSGEIQTPQQIGPFVFAVNIETFSGQVLQKQIPAQFSVSQPLQVINVESKNPVEYAFLELQIFDEISQQYRSINESFIFPHLERGIFQPYQTDEKGMFGLALPKGQYKVDVTAIGYRSASEEFVLGESTRSFPLIALEPEFSVGSFFEYLGFSMNKTSRALGFYAGQMFPTQVARTSLALFNTITFILGCLCVYISMRLKIMSTGVSITATSQEQVIKLDANTAQYAVTLGMIVCLLILVSSFFLMLIFQGLINSSLFLLFSVVFGSLWYGSRRLARQYGG